MADHKTYKTKKILIVDDQAQARFMIKGMVELFGVDDIDLCNNGEKAVTMMQEKEYDIILSDYNLGEGKDGSQILEEVKHLRLLSHSAIFILITAESATEMVMGALEYQPDGYLTKPFKKDELKARLDAILDYKLATKRIDRARDRNDAKAAVKLCYVALQKYPKFKPRILKTLIDICLEQKALGQAQKTLDTMASDKMPPWVMFYFAKIHFLAERYDEAEKAFKELKTKYPSVIAAFDWLAEIYIKKDKPKEAQSTLEDAIKQSPKAILRQMRLGEIAFDNEQWKIAEKAFRTAISLGKFSCHRRPSNYIYMAKILTKKATNTEGMAGKRSGLEALEILNLMRKEFRQNPPLDVNAKILGGEAFQSLGREDEGRKSIMSALNLFDELGGDVPPGVGVELAKTLINIGEDHRGKAIAEQVKEKHPGETGAINEINNIMENSGLNQKGMDLYKLGKLLESLKYFDAAIKEAKGSLSFLLNGLQARIELMEKDGFNKDYDEQCQAGFTRLKTLTIEDPRYPRYREMLRRHKKMLGNTQ